MRLGVTPEGWFGKLGVGGRISYDANSDLALFGSEEMVMVRLEPYALVALHPHWVLGGGVGMAGVFGMESDWNWMGNAPGQSFGPAVTASLLGGYLHPDKHYGFLLRADGSSWPSVAVTVGLTGGLAWPK